tara:strand:+ start:431 stop:985 length:555 start_codon:yes stop_codon:yes gene_type:complete
MVTELIKQILPLITLLSGLFILISVIALIVKKELKLQFVKDNILFFGLLVTGTATLGSLFYSEILGYTPCKLCWIQRIFMYPQMLMFALALWKKDNRVWLYAVPLSIIGGIIALYHYILQVGIFTLPAPCEAVGYSAGCSSQFMLTFGYITIPMMAFTAFILVTILAFMVRNEKPNLSKSKKSS